MAANVYITTSDLTDSLDIRELAQVSAAPSVRPEDIEADLAQELAAQDSGESDAEAAAEVITDSIERANGMIDGYLAGRYELPLSAVPDMLVTVGVRIARYELHDLHATQEITRRYNEAIKYLEKVAAGHITLATDQGIEPKTGGALPTSSAPAPTFTSDTDLLRTNDPDNIRDYMGCL